MFKNIFKKNRTKKVTLTPYRDWLIVLVASGVLLVVIVLYNVYIFRQIISGKFMLPSTEEVMVKTIDKNSVEKSFLLIETKKQKLQTVLGGGVSVSDPSI